MYVLNRLFYYGFIVPLSSLPFSVLYFISDGLYAIIYYVVGYRKRVVMDNLRRSFPSMPEEERKVVAKKFYRHFCDMIVESLKMFTISAEDAHKCAVYTHVDIPDSYFEKGQSILVASGHYANWEVAAVTYDDATKHQSVCIYKPLTNKYFDKKILESRQKYGLRMMHNRKVKEGFEEQKNELTATVLLIDQSPSPHSKPYWMEFLGQETAVLTGTEKYAIEYNYPVVYLHIRKPRRGYYEMSFEKVCDNPRDTKPGEITELATRILEREIRKTPELWLWSHKRWKHKRPVDS
jgi:Kdo2-lipid IVA lauroyltransferase/acyltransferase